ncbi:MAG: hypothetical protein IKW59_09220 [Clostridia bacterium]|nr:hypothetical protein [Clostridia bacterium]
MIGTGKRKNKTNTAGSLAEYMTELLNMPANEEEQERFAANGYKGNEVNQAMLLARSVLDKAIEKGDVSAFKEVKAMLGEDEGGRNELEEMVCAIKKSLAKKKDDDFVKKSDKKSTKSKRSNKAIDKAVAQEPE